MDPDETLRQIREEIDKAKTNEGIEDAHRFVSLVEALDEWLSKAGYLPAAWRPNTAQR